MIASIINRFKSILFIQSKKDSFNSDIEKGLDNNLPPRDIDNFVNDVMETPVDAYGFGNKEIAPENEPIVGIVPVYNGYRFMIYDDVIEIIILDSANSCCEWVSTHQFPNKQIVGQPLKWVQVTKEQLPAKLLQEEALTDDDDKYSSVLAMKVTTDLQEDVYLVVANKHNGYYCHTAKIIEIKHGVERELVVDHL